MNNVAVVKEGITTGSGRSLNFGNYTVKEKIKVKDFEVDGDLFSVKTHDELTRLEKNGKMLVESVPGASFFDFVLKEDEIACRVSGKGDTQITLELEPEVNYKLMANNEIIGEMKSTKAGKINFSLELSEEEKQVKIQKI